MSEKRKKLANVLFVLFVEAPLGAARYYLGEAFYMAVAVAYVAAHCLILWVVLAPFGLGDYFMLGAITGFASLDYLAAKPTVDRGTVVRDEKLGETITGANPE